MTEVFFFFFVHYLVRQAFSRTRAHGIHPKVGVHVVGTDARVGVGDVRQRSHLLPLRPHRHAGRQDPDRAREPQHPQHLRSGTRRKEVMNEYSARKGTSHLRAEDESVRGR